MIRRLARTAVRLGLRHGGVRRLVAAELAADGPRSKPKAGIVPAAEAGAFVDRHGVAHALDPELRTRLKPGWRTMLDPVALAAPPTDDAIRAGAAKAERVVAEAARLVQATAGVKLGGKILEIGCHDGSAAFQLARLEGSTVVGSDLARYYVVQREGRPSEAQIEAQQVRLVELRDRARRSTGVAEGRVRFIEDDITRSALEPATFDAILSFEVLEHVQDPAGAFASMARLLKPGGIGYHDYNPFFSLIGGHSLCTLDFPWGHARLDASDFERYLREIRPDEAERSLPFFRESLNRLTLQQLRSSITEAGLELVAVIPWFDRTLVPRLTPDVLMEVQRTYPTASADDLLASFVAVVVRRPGSIAPG